MQQPRLELDYRPAIPHPPFMPPWAAIFVAASVFGLLLLRPLVKSLASPLFFAIVLVGALTYLAISFHRRRNRGILAIHAAAILLITVGLISNNPVAAYLLFGLALYRLAIQADWYNQHAAMWMRANLFLPPEVRRTWYSVWRPMPMWRRFARGIRHLRGGDPDDMDALATPLPGKHKQMVRDQEIPERIRYEIGFVLLLPAYLAGFVILFLVPVSIFAGLAAIVFFTLLVTAYAIVNINDYRRMAGISWKDVATSLSTANVSWWYYRGNAKPGVFKSPCGPLIAREFKSYFTHVCLAASLALLAAYYPLGPLLAGPTLWQEAAFDLQKDKPVMDETAPRRPASPDTHLYAYRFPPQTADAYLTAVARSQQAEKVQRAKYAAVEPLTASPEGWLLTSYRAGGVLWLPLLLSATACVVFPYIFTFLTVRALSGRAIVHHYLGLEDSDSPYHEPMYPWDAIVRRLKSSQNPQERQHVWLGVNAEDDTPVLVPRKLLFQHAHVLGGSGTRKTSMAMTPLAAQVIGHDCSVVILDLKGDMSLFETARLGALNATLPDGTPSPLPFKWFRSDSGRSTYAFNPFLQSHMKTFTDIERTQIFTKAFGLEYGEGYGKSHFSRQHRHVLLSLFKLRPEIESFRGLAEELKTKDLHAKLLRECGKKEIEDATDLFDLIRTLAEIDALNITSRSGLPKVHDAAIDMAEVVEKPSVIYFQLPAALSNPTDREIGKFALHALLTAAQRFETGRSVYVFIDEFQQLVSEDLEVIFEQARKFRVGTILANHHPAQLAKTGPHVLKSVEESTAITQVFSANDVEFRRGLQELSGESIYHLATYGSEGDVRQYQEQIGSRHRPNDIMRMTARENECWFRGKYNVGYFRTDGFPFIMYAGYHISEEEYNRRDAKPWPSVDDNPQTIAMPLAPPTNVIPTPVAVAPKPATKSAAAPPVTPVRPVPPTTTALDTISFEGADDE